MVMPATYSTMFQLSSAAYKSKAERALGLFPSPTMENRWHTSTTRPGMDEK